MTEEEAKTKWCVQSNIGEVALKCDASACMAWRWVPKAGTDDEGKPNYYTGNWQGFCGLAGKP